MRILIIVNKLTGGGAERVAACWANGLSELGNEVIVMTDLSLPVTYNLNEGIRKISLPKSSGSFIARRLVDPFCNLIYFRRIIKKISPDVILSVMHIYPVILNTSLVGLRKRPFSILTDHYAYERPAYAPFKLKECFRKFYCNRLFNLITVLTHRDAEILKKRGFKNVIVMHNPLFLSPVDSLQTKERIVLAVGRMDGWKVKGFDILIQAWNRIYLKYPSWRLRIVGKASSKTKDYFKGLIGTNHSIELVDYTPDIVEEYRKAAVFVLSSRYEGWGLVLVEAMSQGCASIACDYLGRQAEIIDDGINGMLIEPDSIEQLADAIDRMLSNEDLINDFQKRAPESVKKYSVEKVAMRWMEIFDNYVR